MAIAKKNFGTKELIGILPELSPIFKISRMVVFSIRDKYKQSAKDALACKYNALKSHLPNLIGLPPSSAPKFSASIPAASRAVARSRHGRRTARVSCGPA